MGGQALHRRDQELPGIGLEQEAAGARLQSLTDQAVRVVHGEDQHLCHGQTASDLASGLDPVHQRQSMVEDHDIGPCGKIPIDGFLAVLGLADDLPALVPLQDGPHAKRTTS